MDVIHLDIVVSFAKPDGKIDHLSGDGSVKIYIFLFYILYKMV